MTRCGWVIGVRNTVWVSQARSGCPKSVQAVYEMGDPMQPTSLLDLVAKLGRTDTLQIELQTYGHGRPVATFRIHNHDVFDRFVADCQKS
jgi:hypothetical protein